MSIEALLWIKVGHVFGFVMWVGTLIGSCHVLKAHAQAGGDTKNAFSDLEKGLGIAMDIGATFTLVFGSLLIILPVGGTAIFKAGGFMHLKLTLVLLIIGAHVVLRRKLSQFRKNNIKAPPGWLFPVINVAVLVIIAMIVAQPF